MKKKKYLYVLLIIIGIILLIWYILSWKNVKDEDKYMNSYLLSTSTINLEINDLDEINQVLKESPSKYFIYIGYTKDSSEYNLEKKLKKIIDSYGIKDIFYYINITDIIENPNLYEKLNNAFNTTDIKKAPTLLYYENDELKEIINSNDKPFNPNNLEKILKKYEYEKMS